MDLHLLRTFVAIAQEGHLTRAAERLHISQPTASSHLRALETHFAMPLFVRRSSGLELTSGGRQLLRKAEEVLLSARQLDSTARTIGGAVTGKLTVGSSVDPVMNRIGPLSKAMRDNYPMIELSVEVRHTRSMLRGIRSGEIDAGYFLGQVPEESLACRPLIQLTYCIVGPAAWKEAVLNADWSVLAAMPWIVTGEGHSHNDLLASFFQRRGLALNGVIEVDNEAVVRVMVAEGIGLSLVRSDHAAQGEQDKRMVISPIAVAHTQLIFAYPRTRREEPTIKALVASLAQTWSDFPADESR